VGGVHPGGAQSGMRLAVDGPDLSACVVLDAGHGQVIIAGRSREGDAAAAVVALVVLGALDAVALAGSTRVGSAVRVACAHAAAVIVVIAAKVPSHSLERGMMRMLTSAVSVCGPSARAMGRGWANRRALDQRHGGGVLAVV